MPNRLSPSALRRQIASGHLDPLYVIAGEDEAEKASLAAAFADAVEPGLQAFNVERIYANESRPGESKVAQVLDAVRTMPMLAPRRIVIVLQADRMLMPARESEAAAADQDSLEAYLKDPLPEATLVFVVGAPDKRRRVVRLLYARATAVECGEVVFAGEAEAWVRARVEKDGMTIEGAAARLLVERAGFVREGDWPSWKGDPPGDLGRLRADTERACLYSLDRGRVTAADVGEVVGPETLHDNWAFVDHVRQGRTAAALRELQLLLAAGAVPFMVLGQIRSFVEGGQKRRPALPPHTLPGAVQALFETDLALKSSAGDPRVLLERLVVDLCQRMAAR
jgi:DNA polymerase-3 subunit delta